MKSLAFITIGIRLDKSFSAWIADSISSKLQHDFQDRDSLYFFIPSTTIIGTEVTSALVGDA